MTALVHTKSSYSTGETDALAPVIPLRPQTQSTAATFAGIAIDIAVAPVAIPFNFFVDWATESALCVRSLLKRGKN